MILGIAGKFVREERGLSIPILENVEGTRERYILDTDLTVLHDCGHLQNGIHAVINSNGVCFILDTDYIYVSEVKFDSEDTESELLTHNPNLNASDRILLSESGYSKLVMLLYSNTEYRVLMSQREHANICRNITKEYFAAKEKIVSEEDYNNLKKDYNNIRKDAMKSFNDNARLVIELAEKEKELEEKIQQLENMHTERQIPSDVLIEDVKLFLDEYTKREICGEMSGTELFGVYLYSRRTRKAQPDNVDFENALLETGQTAYSLAKGMWVNISWK